MRFERGVLVVLGGVVAAAACGESERACEETFTCGQVARAGAGGASGGAGAAGGSGGRGGATAGTSGTAGDGLGGEAGEAGSPSSGAAAGNGSGGKGGGGKGGGSASGGAAGAPDDAPPEVLAVTPSDEADDAEPDGTITLRFSEALDASTVTTGTVTLLDDGVEIPSTVDVDGADVTLTPNERLSLLVEYTVRVDASVSDRGGTPMSAEFASTFAVRDFIWSAFEPLSDNGTTEVSVGVDARGNALVGWGSPTGMFTRWHRPGSGWESPFTLEACDCPGNRVQVAASDAGDAVVVYSAQSGRVARLYRGGAWGAEAPMANGSTLAVAIAPTGEAHVITDPSGDPVSLHTDETDAWVESGYNWRSADDPNLSSLALAFDASGNGFAVWENSTLGIRVSRYNRGQASWGVPATIPGSAMGDAPALAVSPTGGALVVWLDGDGAQTDVMASTFSNASGWTTPEPIDTLATLADGVVAAWAGTGFIAAWRQGNGVDTTNVYSSRLSGAVWEDPELRSDGISTAALTYPPALAADAHGNAMLLWRTDNGVWDEVTFARYRAATDDWLPAAPLAPGRITLYGFPRESLGVGANGVVAVGFTGGTEAGTSDVAVVTVFE